MQTAPTSGTTAVVFQSPYPSSRNGQPAEIMKRIEMKTSGSVAYAIKFPDGHVIGVHPEEIGRTS